MKDDSVRWELGDNVKDFIAEQNKAASENGFKVLAETPYQVFIDRDDDDGDCNLDLLKMHGLTIEQRWRSKSGNWHIVLRSQIPLGMVERIALGMAHGSDAKRGAIMLGQLRQEPSIGCVSFLYRPMKGRWGKK